MSTRMSVVIVGVLGVIIGAGVLWYAPRVVHRATSCARVYASTQNTAPLLCGEMLASNVYVTLTITPQGEVYILRDGNEVFRAKSESDGSADPEGPLAEVVMYDSANIFFDAFDFIDINFDGYKDLKLRTGSGAYNMNYEYYLYDVATGKFQRTPILSLTNPEFNEETRTMISFFKGRGLGDIYSEETYQFREGSYVLVKEVVQDFAGEESVDGYTYTESELMNGAMIETMRKHLSEEEVMGRYE